MQLFHSQTDCCKAILLLCHAVDICFVFPRYFGCGLPFPTKLEGCRVLDLGSGSGRDCFAFSKLVGESGYVIGIDMTEELVMRETCPRSSAIVDCRCPVCQFISLLFRSQCLVSMPSTIRRRLALRKPTCLLSRATWRSSMRREYQTTPLMR